MVWSSCEESKRWTRRGSSVPIMDAETRRRVAFSGFGKSQPTVGARFGTRKPTCVWPSAQRSNSRQKPSWGSYWSAPTDNGRPFVSPWFASASGRKSFVTTRTIHWNSSTCGDTITNITRRARVDETSARIGKHDAATGCAATAVYANDDFVHGAATAAASAVDDTAASATAATATATGESPLTSGWCS